MIKRFSSVLSDAWSAYRHNQHFVAVAMVLQFLYCSAQYIAQHAQEFALPTAPLSMCLFMVGGASMIALLELSALDVCRRVRKSQPVDVPDAVWWALRHVPRYWSVLLKFTILMLPLVAVSQAIGAGIAHIAAHPDWSQMWHTFSDGVAAQQPMPQTLRAVADVPGAGTAFACMGATYVAVWGLLLYGALTTSIGVMETPSLVKALRLSITRMRGNLWLGAAIAASAWIPMAIDASILHYTGETAKFTPILAIGSIAIAPLLALLRGMFYFHCLPQAKSDNKAAHASGEGPALVPDVVEERLH